MCGIVYGLADYEGAGRVLVVDSLLGSVDMMHEYTYRASVVKEILDDMHEIPSIRGVVPCENSVRWAWCRGEDEFVELLAKYKGPEPTDEIVDRVMAVMMEDEISWLSEALPSCVVMEKAWERLKESL